MNDFKLKIVLAVLSSVVFSFIFILLAFVMPSKNVVVVEKKAENKLQAISQALRKN